MQVDEQDQEVSANSAKALFFSDSEDEAKEPVKSTSDVIDISSSPDRPVKPSKPVASTSKPVKRKADHAPVASSSSSSPKKVKLDSDIKIPLDAAGQPIADWTWKYFGRVSVIVCSYRN